MSLHSKYIDNGTLDLRHMTCEDWKPTPSKLSTTSSSVDLVDSMINEEIIIYVNDINSLEVTTTPQPRTGVKKATVC